MKYRKLPYYVNCIEMKSDSDRAAIEKMIEDATPVSWSTFKKHVNLDHVRKLFPQYYWRGYNKKSDLGNLTLWNDWHVQFFRSKIFGGTCYFLVHSAIEYVFSVYGAYKEFDIETRAEVENEVH